ncbi:ribonuclease J [Paenisporosarcina quisquiliarum]|uniref:Ribonuclease J n=1 Tax=Paenisporosarcina quisquiliarum TaxID=365346 RepID=A0A9X3LIU4_9BACL|nr:ribonuclease J [Paenisporosarcina quisquiliarum]MCZ8537801.1 ribonuclease J [Paenisporosarcina quisquiliarum]
MDTVENSLSIFALGGVNEIGKNMYVLQVENDIVVIDCGSKFPDESLLGIDLIIQDISYLQENKDKVRALIVTHGHEDHIGGIPYLLKQLNMPVYASRMTLGLIEIKLKEHGLLRQTEMNLIDSKSKINFNAITCTFFKTNHSIPDCLGIAFHTSEGVIVHTGDFKFDLTPVNNEYADIHEMAELGKKGVLVLLSESTNAERPGFTPSESLVGGHIEDAFRKANRKIFISTFASNVHRVQQVVDAAQKTNRKLVLLGRSMVNVVSVAMEQGHLNVPEGMIIEPHDIKRMAPENVAILCTGSQGEPMAALSRLASSNYRQVEILPEDTVIFASSPIPGNERNVSRVIDNLYRLRAKVIYGSGSATGMHVSGHACQEELRLMLTLMKPKYFIPIHGELRMLHQHRLIAESVGVERENVFIINNGDVVDVNNSIARQTRKVPSGNIFVDGLGIGDVGNIVLRDRKLLSEDGMIVIVITLSKSDGQIISGPDTISRGFVYARDAEELMKEVDRLVVTTIQTTEAPNGRQRNVLKQSIKATLGKFLYAKTKRRPMILPIIIEI